MNYKGIVPFCKLTPYVRNVRLLIKTFSSNKFSYTLPLPECELWRVTNYDWMMFDVSIEF